MEASGQLLNKVKDFAGEAHAGQTRRYSDDPYIVHPIRVMERCRKFTSDLAILSAALLHDVLEDTPVSKHEISRFLHQHMDAKTANRTLQFVEELTDIFTKTNHPRSNRKDRKRMEAERLSKTSHEAQSIKYADIIDNTDVTEHEPDFAKVYLKEALQLLNLMDAGEPLLRKLAFEKVNDCLQRLSTDLAPRT